MSRRNLNIFAALLAAVTMLCAPCAVRAANERYSLQIDFVTDSGAISGCEFSLYYVMDENRALAGDFALLPIETGDLSDADNVRALAGTLDGYIKSGVGTPVESAVTNGAGTAVFSNLKAGVYLISGAQHRSGSVVYTPEPVLAEVNAASETITYVSVKYSSEEDPENRQSVTVKKKWEGPENPAAPSDVTVFLYRDGEKYDEAVLSAQNSWEKTWVSLETAREWSVAEQPVPDGYTVRVTREGYTFTVINTYNPTDKETTPAEVPPAETEPEETKPAGVPPAETNPAATTPDEDESVTKQSGGKQTDDTLPSGEKSSSPADKDNYSDTDLPPSGVADTGEVNEKLPQTGQLWWPVPVLICLGTALFAIGFVSRESAGNRKNEKEASHFDNDSGSGFDMRGSGTGGS